MQQMKQNANNIFVKNLHNFDLPTTLKSCITIPINLSYTIIMSQDCTTLLIVKLIGENNTDKFSTTKKLFKKCFGLTFLLLYTFISIQFTINLRSMLCPHVNYFLKRTELVIR